MPTSSHPVRGTPWRKHHPSVAEAATVNGLLSPYDSTTCFPMLRPGLCKCGAGCKLPAALAWTLPAPALPPQTRPALDQVP